MKANSPEKIYIQPNAHDGWFETNNLTESLTEYIRKDAFIEKTCAWLEENADMFEAFDSETKTYYMDKNAMIEDFKKAMKGE